MPAMACSASYMSAGGSNLADALVDAIRKFEHGSSGGLLRLFVIRTQEPRFAGGVEIFGIHGVAGVALHTEFAGPLRHHFA